MTQEELKEYIVEHGDPDALVFENPDYTSAFVGLTSDGLCVYDYGRMCIHLIENDDMDLDEAEDFIGYNTIRSLPYFEKAPIILFPVETIDQLEEINEQRETV